MSDHIDSVDQVDPLDSLRHELASLSVSPEFAAKVRSRIAEEHAPEIDVLKEELAAVSVSPEFAVRVRQQIEAAPSRTRWFAFLDWRWAAPVAAAIIAAVALTRGGGRAPQVLTPSSTQASASQAATSRPPQDPQTASTGPSTPAVPPPGPSFETTSARATQRTGAPAAASGQQAEDKLEVITNQQELYRQLWAIASVAPVVRTSDSPAEAEIAIVPVEVAPVVVQWIVEPPAPQGAAPTIRRVSAVAERSDK